MSDPFDILSYIGFQNYGKYIKIGNKNNVDLCW